MLEKKALSAIQFLTKLEQFITNFTAEKNINLQDLGFSNQMCEMEPKAELGPF